MREICLMLAALSLSASACHRFPSEANEKQSSPKVLETPSPSVDLLAKFRNDLETIDISSPGIGKAQQEFRELFPPDSQSAEEGFRIFRSLHQRFVDECNRKLVRNAELQAVLGRFPVIHDQTLVLQEKIDEQVRAEIKNQYPDALAAIGEGRVVFKSQEGDWFVAPDVNYYVDEVLKGYDFPYKEYLEFVNQEERDAVAEDAALFISWEGLRQKIIRYEMFARKHPDLAETQAEIVPRTQRYLSWYLEGLDNTPLDQSAYESWKKFLQENKDSRYYPQVQKRYTEHEAQKPE